MSTLPPTFLPNWHYEDLVNKVKYKRLGTTNMVVSQMGIGGCVVGGVYPDKAEKEEIFQVGQKSKIHLRNNPFLNYLSSFSRAKK